MVLYANCYDFLTLYKCKDCVFSTNEKTYQQFHNCTGDNRSEVNDIKHLGYKGLTNSFSMLWIISHGIKHKQFENETNKISVPKNVPKAGRFSCDQCEASFAFKKNLKIHLNAKHVSDDQAIWYECEHCHWKTKSRQNLKFHHDCKHFAGKKQYQCTECDFQTQLRDKFKRHSQKHIPDELAIWYDCNICSYRTKRKNHLKQHLQGVHTPDDQLTWFQCTICEFKAKWQFSLKKHLKQKHCVENFSENYKCSECVYETHIKYRLNEHILLKHTPDHLINWSKCDICIFKSKRRSGLNEHMRKMHASDDKVKWFKCQICKARYKKQSSLTRHMASCHSNAMHCFDCGFKATDFKSLRSHLHEKHARVNKRYQCDKCLYHADRQFHLVQHFQAVHPPNS